MSNSSSKHPPQLRCKNGVKRGGLRKGQRSRLNGGSPKGRQKSKVKTLKKKQGKIFVISAPSGTGKTTLADILLRSRPGFIRSVSYTTRKPRGSEKNGRDYHFISKADFFKKIKEGFFAEWAKVYADYYGTSKEFLGNALKSGKNAALVIDTQGAFQIRRMYPGSVLVFIAPPSFKELKRRLVGRGTEKSGSVAKRLVKARKEMRESRRYTHIVVNDNLKKASGELKRIITGYLRK